MIKRFTQYLQPTHELTAHDGVLGMDLTQGSTLIFDVGPEKLCRELKLHFLDSGLVGRAKKETDHPVTEHSVNESVDDLSQLGLTAHFFEKRFRHEK